MGQRARQERLDRLEDQRRRGRADDVKGYYNYFERSKGGAEHERGEKKRGGRRGSELRIWEEDLQSLATLLRSR